MDITPRITKERQVVQAYGDGGFKVSGQQYSSSLILFPDQSTDWAITHSSEITLESLAPVTARAGEIDILLIGFGQDFLRVPEAVRTHFRALGVTVEAMDTGAACRTYNVLMSEERRVAAALVAV